VPITAPEQWAPLIRRCIVHERTTLVAMFDSLLRAPPPANPTDILKRWHERAGAHFLELAQQRETSPLALQSRVTLSYAVRRADSQLIDPRQLIDIVRQVNLEVHDLVSSPLLFYPYTIEGITPYFTEDSESGQANREILECALFEDTPLIFRRIDFWRMSLDGLATHVRPFWEDREDMRVHSKREPGSWFCPFYHIRALAELTRHARAFATRFAAAETVEFRCEWHGLANRELFDPRLNLAPWFPGRIARADHRVTIGEWPVAELVAWPRIVSALGAPVMRLFHPDHSFAPEWVAQQEPAFRVP
jgi:hypothetical protein